jgi:ribosomal protein S24E
MIEVTRDVNNSLLARREISCIFKGLAGKLKKPEAVDVVSKHFKLDGKVIVAIKLQNETGRPMVSGTFYVYDDEKLARQHIKPAIFARLDKAKAGGEKPEEVKEAPAEKEVKEEKKSEEKPKEEKKADDKPKKEEMKTEDKPKKEESK